MARVDSAVAVDSFLCSRLGWVAPSNKTHQRAANTRERSALPWLDGARRTNDMIRMGALVPPASYLQRSLADPC
jgi:hypothetical protein